MQDITLNTPIPVHIDMLQSILTKIQMFISTSQGMETPKHYKVKEDIIAKKIKQKWTTPTEKRSDKEETKRGSDCLWLP